MSVQLITDGTVVFNTSGVSAPSPTTLNGGITSGDTSATFTSGTNVTNGAYVTILAEGSNTTESVLVVSGTGATRTITRAQLGTAASAHGSGATVIVPGSETFSLLPNTSVPNQVLFLAKISSDINFVNVVAGGTNYFPGGVTSLLLIDNSGLNGQTQIKFPSIGNQLIVLSGVGSGAGAGAPGPPGPAGTSVPAAPNILSANYATSFIPNGNAFPFDAFSGVITLPVSDPNYSHLKQINITAQDPYGNQFFVASLSSSGWSGSTTNYNGIIGATQPSATQNGWELIFVVLNDIGAPTPGPYVISSVTVSAPTLTVGGLDLGTPWRDDNGALHKIIQISATVTNAQYCSFWLDIGDGNGPLFEGWWPVTSSGWSLALGGPSSAVNDIYFPTNPSESTWTIWMAPGAISSPTPSGVTGAISATFAVSVAAPCPSNDVTGAQFNPNPLTAGLIDYVLSNPGTYNWAYYQIQWNQPTLAADPSYWVSFITVQKGLAQNGTCTVGSGGTTVTALSGFTFSVGQVGNPISLNGVTFRIATYVSPTSVTLGAAPGCSASTATNGTGVSVEVWNPAPDKEGSNDLPGTGGVTPQYWGRSVAGSGAIAGIPGVTNSTTVVQVNGSWPPNWTDPWVANVNDPTGATTAYVQYRFWIWAVSIMGMSPANTSASTITLQTSAWAGADHGVLLPQQQPAAIDAQQINPYTTDESMMGGGGTKLGVQVTGPLTKTSSGVSVLPGAITNTYLAAASVGASNLQANAITVANSSSVIQALALVDGLIASVGLNKLAATTLTQGTAIFTADAIFSRGSGNPLIDLSYLGMYLYSQANSSNSGGLTSQPYVAIQGSGIGLLAGTNPATGFISSVIINSYAITLWAVNGDSNHPYTQLSSAGFYAYANTVVSGLPVTNSASVSAGGIVLTSGSASMVLQPASFSISNGSGPQITMYGGTGTISGHSLSLSLNGIETTIGNIYVPSVTAYTGIQCLNPTTGQFTGLSSFNFYSIGDSGGGSATVGCVGASGSAYGSLGLSGPTASGYSIGLRAVDSGGPSIRINAVKVLGPQQTGPGNASGWSDSTAQSWANNLLTALRAHGLIT